MATIRRPPNPRKSNQQQAYQYILEMMLNLNRQKQLTIKENIKKQSITTF